MTPAERIREDLAAAADPARAPAMQAYMKSEMPFLGIRRKALTDALRPILRQLPEERSVWLDTATDLWDRAEYREHRYAGLAVLRSRRHQRFWEDRDRDLVERLVRTGAWWDLVDETATKLLGPLRRDRGWDVLSWAADEDLWIRRSVIICQVGAKSATDPGFLAAAIEPSLDDRRFFLTKAIGWALRDYARTDPEWVRAYVDDHADRLAGLSRREATKHL